MSATPAITVRKFAQMKGKKIAVLTAYDYHTARYLDDAGIDALLVGDSVNMVYHGEPSTLSVDMDIMLAHTRAVSRATTHALVIGDLPFLSYQPSERDAILNAGRFLKEAGAQAVKLEGGVEMANTVRRIVEMGIPVMGHIGLTPQSIHRFGGYQVQGKSPEKAAYLEESAQALTEAGVFGMVIEAVPRALAKKITDSVSVPTIGIGAGPDTDGQVMVINDIAGLFTDFQPRFVRRYGELGKQLTEISKQFIADVRSGDFPSDEESY
jgi:3-methyl-2-oxobutanoate hydroxymethyltransferase